MMRLARIAAIKRNFVGFVRACHRWLKPNKLVAGARYQRYLPDLKCRLRSTKRSAQAAFDVAYGHEAATRSTNAAEAEGCPIVSAAGSAGSASAGGSVSTKAKRPVRSRTPAAPRKEPARAVRID